MAEETIVVATRVTRDQLEIINSEIDAGHYCNTAQFIAAAIREKIRLCEEAGD